MPKNKRLRIYSAMFFWGILLSYLFAAPRMYRSALEGYADFSNFYSAGKILQNGQGRRLYDMQLQTEVQSQFSQAAAQRNRALFYMRPPFEAVLFLPFSHLSYPAALRLWLGLSLLMVGLSLALVRARIPGQTAIPWWIHYPACFSFCPVAYGFATGQDHALMLLLFSLVLIHLYEHKDLRAGCFLGLALIKFQLVLPLVLVLILKKKWRTLAGFASVGAGLLAVGISAVGWEGLKGYPIYLWRLNRVRAAAAIYPSMMPSLRGLVQGWGNSMTVWRGSDLLTLVLSLTVLVWAARQWKATAPSSSKIYLAGVGCVLLATLLAGYHTFIYDLSFLLPIILWATSLALCDEELDSTTRTWLLASGAVLLLAPLHLFLIGREQVNLLALAELTLMWGLARAIRCWQASVSRHSVGASVSL